MSYWKFCSFIVNYFRVEFQRPEIIFKWWNPELFAWIGGLTFFLIICVSIIKTVQMTKPIEYVMSIVGATEVTHEVLHLPTNKFINVVEEMSIASGVPVPHTYVMTREQSINALAVGNSPSDAAIAVTGGAINMLTRDELQGVIANEFSHILNGDMRLNVKLIGILYGIDFIGFAGKTMFRALIASAKFATKGMDNVAAFFSWIGLFITLPFLFISYVGVALGGIIRAAICRQREYLADASAVQFTRNPSGIADALKKIGGLIFGSDVSKSSASFASHFFFATSSHNDLLDRISAKTHPPLKKRIKKIDPQFDGQLPYVPSHYRVEQGPLQSIDWLPKPSGTGTVTRPEFNTAVEDPEEIVQSIGVPKAEHLAYVTALFASLPSDIMTMVRDTSGAQAIIYSFLLDKAEDIRRLQLEYLAKNSHPDVYERIQKVIGCLPQMGQEVCLPLTDVAIPALRNGLDRQGYETFENNIDFLITADKREDMFEFVMKKVIQRHVRPHFIRTKLKWTEYSSMAALRQECIFLLACLIHWVEKTKGNAAVNNTEELNQLGITADDLAAKSEECDLSALTMALEKLSHAKLFLKKRILAACAAYIMSDEEITVVEAELFRAIADAMNCIIPPIIAGRIKQRKKAPRFL
jgi:Zn-dependent protease with chaperone function